MAIALAIYFFFKLQGLDPTPVPDSFWGQYGLYSLLAAAVPALWYLPRYKRTLDAYIADSKSATPGVQKTMELLRRLSIGGGLCELPMALGVVQLLTTGGQLRLFVGGACISFAMRLSYRPFRR